MLEAALGSKQLGVERRFAFVERLRERPRLARFRRSERSKSIERCLVHEKAFRLRKALAAFGENREAVRVEVAEVEDARVGEPRDLFECCAPVAHADQNRYVPGGGEAQARLLVLDDQNRSARGRATRELLDRHHERIALGVIASR